MAALEMLFAHKPSVKTVLRAVGRVFVKLDVIDAPIRVGRHQEREKNLRKCE